MSGIQAYGRGLASGLGDLADQAGWAQAMARGREPQPMGGAQLEALLRGQIGGESTTPSERILEGMGQLTPAAALFAPLGAAGGLGIGAEAALGTLGLGASETAREYGAGGLGQLLADVGSQVAAPGLLAKGLGAGALQHAVIPAFHGTPHRWAKHSTLDRIAPDMSRLRTGEGAQAFGIGHYSAQNPDVAREYMNAGFGAAARAEEWALKNPDLARKFNEQVAAIHSKNEWFDPDMEQLGRVADQIKKGNLNTSEFPISRDVMDSIAADYGDPSGRMYGLLHDVNDEDLLDLDLPLSKQSEKIRKALSLDREPADIRRELDELSANFEKSLPPSNPDEVDFLELATRPRTPEDEAYDARVRELQQEMKRALMVKKARLLAGEGEPTGYDLVVGNGVDGQQAMEALKDAGIPGSKFYDQGSRGRVGGERTHNYVMFRDDLTYVDPERTDKRLWDQLPIGKPFRTVGGE